MASVDLDTFPTFPTFGEYLCYLRRRAGLTQRELGIAVGYSDVQIARLEKSRRLPDVTTVQARFIEALGVQDQPALAARLVDLAVVARSVDGNGRSAERSALPPQRRTNLRAPLTRFIGREREIQMVEGIIARSRLVTLTGAGGVGKTRLAMEVGDALLDQFPDGVWLVEFAPLGDPALVPPATASAFNLPDQAVCSPVDLLLDHLRDKQLLLILDNCEHLVQACAELAEALLRGCPDLRILATSLEPLQASAEVIWRVPSLSAPDPAQMPPLPEVLDYEAVQLFVERAAATRPGFTLAPEDLAVIVQVCHRLDGIPLALELAASCLHGLSLHEIAAHLDDRFRLLTSGRRTALPRHQTLRATLDWSYGLLSEPERVLLRRLSVFAGGWTAEAAEAVCADPTCADAALCAPDVLPLLLSLVSKSLVDADAGVRGERTRYHMLETVRQYAGVRLMEAGEGEVAQAHSQHLDYYLALTRWIEPFEPFEPFGWESRLSMEQAIERELDNYRAALMWSLSTPPQDERGLRLVWALEAIWFDHGHLTEGSAWLSRALAKWTSPTPLRARALNTAGLLNLMQGNDGAAQDQLAECIRLARAVDDKLVLFDALARMASVTDAQAGVNKSELMEQAYGYVTESLRIAREIGHRCGIANGLCLMGTYMLHRSQPAEARRLVEESLGLHAEMGDKPGVAGALSLLARCAIFESDWTSARSYLERSVAITRENNLVTSVATHLLTLGWVVREQGDYALAVRLLEECEGLNRQAGFPRVSGLTRICLAHLGRALQLQGNTGRALAVLGESADLCRQAADKDGLARGLSFLAALLLSQRDLDGAACHYRESLQLAHAAADRFWIAVALAGLAEVARLRNDITRAACQGGAVSALGDIQRLVGFHDWGQRDTPTDRLEYDRTMAALRAQLDDPVIAAAWAEGRAMTMEQVVAYALDVKEDEHVRDEPPKPE